MSVGAIAGGIALIFAILGAFFSFRAANMHYKDIYQEHVSDDYAVICWAIALAAGAVWFLKPLG